MALKNQINTYADLTAYNDDQNKEYPNVSYIVATDEVKWVKKEPKDQTYVVCKYDVTSTESATNLVWGNYLIEKMYIDGVEQPSAVASYTFATTGEHTVKYKVSSWGNNLFLDCSRMISATIPDNISIGGWYIFRRCTNLTKIDLPNSNTTIGNGFLWSCSSLGKLEIPSSVTSIGNNAFDGCTSLTSIKILATTPPTLGNANAFNNTNNCPIYVPASSVEAYQTAWSSLASRIQAIP